MSATRCSSDGEERRDEKDGIDLMRECWCVCR